MPPIIPVLKSDINTITKPVDIIKHVLQYYVSAPKNINDTFANSEISFRYDDAELGGDSEALAQRVTNELTDVFSRYFPNASTIDVDVNREQVDEVRYNISIDVLVIVDKIPYTISQDYKVDANGNLAYTFQGE